MVDPISSSKCGSCVDQSASEGRSLKSASKLAVVDVGAVLSKTTAIGPIGAAEKGVDFMELG